MQQKTQWRDVCLLRNGVRRTYFFVILCHFLLFLPDCWPQKWKFGKNVKNTWRYYPFPHVNHKSRSYDVWFMRYKVQRAEFFVILGHFCPDSDPPNNPKIQNFEKIKNRLEILSFYNCAPQMMINDNPKN